MFAKIAFLVSALGLSAVVAPQANASVIYEVFNPSAKFVFFVYNSPKFITTDTLVPASSLAFNNSVHPATFVDFIISSPLDPGYTDVQITINPTAGVPTVQDKFVPAADLARDGTYQFAVGSYGYPHSYLLVAAPEPSTIALMGTGLTGLVGLLGLRRRT